VVPQQGMYGAPSNYQQIMRSQPANDTLFEQNKYAMGTFIASALSVLFALGTGFVPLIFTPFFLAFYSKSRNEKLAPLAFGAAIICGVVGFITLRSRF
jgi:Sec-independent protein secretion pathway component TatC